MNNILCLFYCFILFSCTSNNQSKLTCYGLVEGDIVFPGEGIPSDLKVCAYDSIKKKIFSFQKRIVNPKTNLFCYYLRLPEGRYVLYAETNDFIDEDHHSITRKGYFTDFVKNKHYLDSEVSSHKPLLINVLCNDTLKGITVGDFWD